jgi:hypothetical protein
LIKRAGMVNSTVLPQGVDMPDCDYHVIAIVPGSSFDSDAAMSALTDSGYTPQLETKDGAVMGIRIREADGWGIVAWVEDDPEETAELIGNLKDEPPSGVSSDQIAGCEVALSVWSDDDPDLMNAHVFEEFIQCLKSSLGYFIYDNRLGEWR